ncbi:MAG: type II restriction endonuclease [Acidobacteria bacterium]|nr:type II restriction endonuclease [Acidobacteriota bacterium]
MAGADLTEWLDQHSGPEFIWYVKRLSGNDTLANKSHQVGPYIPREFLFELFPDLNKPTTHNPDHYFPLFIDSHPDARRIRAIWYNNKLRGGTRNETRLTQFGGACSALLDPESTGALTVFAFHVQPGGSATECHVWVCRNETEEDFIEDRIGPVEPGKALIWSVRHGAIPQLLSEEPLPRVNCRLSANEIPPPWLTQFPTGETIIAKTVELRSDSRLDPDRRLLRRRECEFEIFQSVEEAVELPVIKAGFETIDKFIARAQTVLQRRKARSGRSLELHTRRLFIEERLAEGTDFSHQPQSEPGKRPDFLFPSEAAYHDRSFPDDQLRMLAVKTTCKDRWRQILNEADRIPAKHLLTLQEGISVNQFQEMVQARVQLVVPEPLKTKFLSSVQEHLQTLESFIADVRLLRVSS